MRKYLFIFIFIFSNSLIAKSNLDVLSQLPAIYEPQISPDGQYLGYMQPKDDFYNIIVKNLKNPKKKPVAVTLSDARIRHFRWVSERYITFTASTPYYSSGDNAWFTMYRMGILDAEKGDIEWAFDGSRYRYNVQAPTILYTLPKDPEHILVSYYYLTGAGGHSRYGLFRVDLTDGSIKNLESSPERTQWLLDEAGNFAGYRRRGDDEEHNNLYLASGDGFTLMQDHEGAPFRNSVARIHKGKLYYYAADARGVDALFAATWQDNKLTEGERVLSFGNNDVDGILVDQSTSELVGGYGTKEFEQNKYFLDQDLAQTQADLEATFPNAEVEMTSYTKNRDTFVVSISGPQNPLEYFLYYRSKGQISFLASGYPGLDMKFPLEVTPYSYTASDGVEIPGYLAMPTGKKSLPLIVIPHGGPEARDTLSFDWMRQFFVREGYAVYQPNFRGSSGFGTKFVEKGHNEWGKRMQQDVYEGVTSLIEKKLVDPKRICIVGGSYGGYVALLAATEKQEMFKCAVSYAGLSDLTSFLDHNNKQENTVSYFEKFIGKKDDSDYLDSISPLKLVTKDTLPTLLMHGNDDTVVDVEQSVMMYNAMIKAGAKDAILLRGPGEDHWFSLGASRRVFLNETLQFVEKYTK